MSGHTTINYTLSSVFDSRFAKAVTMTPSDHPRPQLERAQWRDLCGEWRFAFDDAQSWRVPDDVTFDRTITVPYPPESAASGIADTGFHSVVWYARTLTHPASD